MRVLSIIHENGDSPGLFGRAVREQGHDHVEWRISHDPDPPDGPFDAAMVFGGTMDTHEEESFPWLRRENAEIRRLIGDGTPLLGVCLGGQLLAKALDARVERAPAPEIGWEEVRRTAESRDDPVIGSLPERFISFQWHHYRFELPDGAVPLAVNPVCLQAFRFADHVWGVQFHPEVSRDILQEWFDVSEHREPIPRLDYRALERAHDLHIGEWVRIGAAIVSGFLGVAAERACERTGARAV